MSPTSGWFPPRTNQLHTAATRIIFGLPIGLLLAGCSMTTPAPPDPQLRTLASRYVRSAMKFQHSPAVRAQAMEAGESLPADERVAIRDGLKDEHPGVRFAACMALGRLRDRPAQPALKTMLNDRDASVRVGAYFALERLGDTGYRTQWIQALRRHAEPAVRSNAAMALGQLEDKSVLPLLDEAGKMDQDESVRVQALEGLAALGDSNAISRLVHDAYGGIGYKQPFALLALARVHTESVTPTLRSRLAASPYLEARLAAARGLGMHGYDAGLDLAMECLNWTEPPAAAVPVPEKGAKDAKKQQPPPVLLMPVVDDSPENARMRIRSMAALAVGAIGDRRALPWLKQRMETPDDPRVQLAAARAILMILEKPGTSGAAQK